VLNFEELAAVWGVLDELDEDGDRLYDPRVAGYVRLLVLTGSRSAEVRGARWEEGRGDLWEIPAERSKNKRPHVVPLSAQALAVLEQLRPLTGESEHVLASTVKRGSAIGRQARLHHDLARGAGVRPFVMHDLRRTAATHLTRNPIKLSRFLVGRVLGHVDPTITGRYDKNDYLDENRAALRKWGKVVERLAGGLPVHEGAEVVIHPAAGGSER
jgi:integrase